MYSVNMNLFKLPVTKPLLYRATKSPVIPEISIYELPQRRVTGNFHQRCTSLHVSFLGRPLASPIPASPLPFPSSNTNFLPATAAKFTRCLHLLTTSNQMFLHSQSIPRPRLTWNQVLTKQNHPQYLPQGKYVHLIWCLSDTGSNQINFTEWRWQLLQYRIWQRKYYLHMLSMLPLRRVKNEKRRVKNEKQFNYLLTSTTKVHNIPACLLIIFFSTATLHHIFFLRTDIKS